MRKLTGVLLLFILALTVGSQTASAGACTTESLSNYLVAGFTCTIGDKTFSDFTYTSSNSGGASLLLSSGVTVVPETVGSEIGFLFTAGWGVGPGQSQGSLIDYTVTAGPGFNIVDAVLTRGGSSFGTGSVSVSDALGNGTTLLLPAAGTVSATFAGTSSLTVDNTVKLSGGRLGIGGLSSVENLFSQSAVPEPGSMLLLGSGLVVLGGKLRRRRSRKSVTA